MATRVESLIPPRPVSPLDDGLLELLPVAVYVCDADGRITRYNRRAAELWGRAPSPGEADARYCGAHRLYWPDGRPLPHAETPMAEALRTGRPQRNLEVMIEQPLGRRVWVLVNIDPLRDEGGALVGAVNCFQDITARKEAEEGLEQSEARLQGIVATTPECIKIVARDGTLVQMNASGLSMVEAASAAEVIGGCVFDLIAPEHREDWRHNHARVCDGEPLRWEFDVIALHGTRRHMETHAAPLRLADGTVAQLAITRDVTSRRRDELALRESERRLRELFDAIPAAIYTTDAEGRVTYFNQAARQLAGRAPQIGVDRWCVTWRLRRLDGSALPHDECPMAVALRERRPVRGVEAVAERPDGSLVPFMPYPTPLFDSEGNLTGAVNMLVDITDRKNAEVYARRLAAIVESSHDAIISAKLDGAVTSWNAGAERLFGYAADEILGRSISTLMAGERGEEQPSLIARISRGERIEHFQTVCRRKDGTPVDVSLSVSPLRDPAGRIIGASSIARDVTAERRELERRQLLINELNHRVKNTLATVQSLAAQTFRGHAGDAARRFEERLVALSRAHDILTRENWEGADLGELVRAVVAPICGDPGERLALAGPRLRLRPAVVVPLAMALHELATNAAKYGSLSGDVGRIAVAWSVEHAAPGRRLRLSWRESGGPPVPPTRGSGFGTRLLERALARQLEGVVRLDFAPSGVVCEIDASLP